MKRILLSFFLFIFAAVATAANIVRIDIVYAAKNPNLKQLSQAVQQELQKQILGIPITINTDVEADPAVTNQALLIGIGDSVLPWSYSEKNNYAATINFYVNSTDSKIAKRYDGKVSALYRDQPLARQLGLAKLLIPNLHNAALLYDRVMPIPLTQLQRESGVEIETITTHDNPDWARALSQLMQHSDVLLGIDDPRVYNSETIRSILLTTYRHGKVLIGPSRPFVHAGALASCYTSPTDYLQQLAAMVKARLQRGRLPQPQYPRVFSIAVNPQVAVSLNLSIPDEKALSAWAQNQTGECPDGC